MLQNYTTSSSITEAIKLNFTVAICISVLIVIVNAIPIWIIISTSTIRRNMSNKFLLNLLVSHFAVGVVYAVYMIIQLFHIKMPNIIGSFSMIISFALTVLAIDKLGCIKYPFYYRNLPKWVSFLIMSLCWMLGTIHLVLGIMFSAINSLRNIKITFFVIGFVESMILFVSNILIFKETRRHIKAISSSMTSNIDTANTSVVTNKNTVRIGDMAHDSSNTAKLRKQFIQKKEIRAAYICILMATSYVIFWIPFYVVYFIDELRTEINLAYTVYVAMTNSIADPVIYISLNKKIRSTVIKRITQMFPNS